MMSISKEAIGLDIGTHSIKLIVLEEKENGIELKYFKETPLAPGIIERNYMLNTVKLTKGIEDIIKAIDIKTKAVIVGLSGPQFILKKIPVAGNIPESEEGLEKLIRREAEYYIPYDIDEIYLGYELLKKNESEVGYSNDTEFCVVGIHEKDLIVFMQPLIDAGLDPVIVDIEYLALENIYKYNYESKKDKIIALINLGKTYINMNILVNGISVLHRDVSIEELLVDKKEQDIQKKASEELILEEIKMTFEVFNEIYREKIAKIILSGGLAKTKGIDKTIEIKLGIPIEILDPFREIRFNKDIFTADQVKDIGPIATVGLGLALRGVTDFHGMRKINMLTSEAPGDAGQTDEGGQRRRNQNGETTP